MIYIAVNQQVTMRANYLHSPLMTSQGPSCNCNVGLRSSGAELPWKGVKPEICNAYAFLRVLSACTQSFCTDWVHKRPAGNREVYIT